jgi:hypothetical protein
MIAIILRFMLPSHCSKCSNKRLVRHCLPFNDQHKAGGAGTRPACQVLENRRRGTYRHRMHPEMYGGKRVHHRPAPFEHFCTVGVTQCCRQLPIIR